MSHYKTIIVSDVHMPSPESKNQRFLTWLEQQTFDQLIFNGDIIDGVHIKLFGWWKAKHEQRIKDVIRIARHQWVRIEYILGNHEINIKKIVPRLAHDVDILHDKIYTSGDTTYYICHGHQFNKKEEKITPFSCITFAWITVFYWINRCYNTIRNIFWLPYQSLISRIKPLGKRLLVGGRPRFEQKIIATCREKHVQWVICGHLHKAECSVIGGFHYLNSGDWIDLCTVLVEHENNNRELISLADML